MDLIGATGAHVTTQKAGNQLARPRRAQLTELFSYLRQAPTP
jgi:hypothetical protein